MNPETIQLINNIRCFVVVNSLLYLSINRLMYLKKFLLRTECVVIFHKFEVCSSNIADCLQSNPATKNTR